MLQKDGWIDGINCFSDSNCSISIYTSCRSGTAVQGKKQYTARIYQRRAESVMFFSGSGLACVAVIAVAE